LIVGSVGSCKHVKRLNFKNLFQIDRVESSRYKKTVAIIVVTFFVIVFFNPISKGKRGQIKN
jgi:hypothetical protein